MGDQDVYLIADSVAALLREVSAIIDSDDPRNLYKAKQDLDELVATYE